MIRLRSNLIPNDWTQESMTRVYLIRPGATCFDLENRIAGDLDLPLCKEGVEQINRLKDQLTDLRSAIKSFETEFDQRLDACLQQVSYKRVGVGEVGG